MCTLHRCALCKNCWRLLCSLREHCNVSTCRFVDSAGLTFSRDNQVDPLQWSFLNRQASERRLEGLCSCLHTSEHSKASAEASQVSSKKPLRHGLRRQELLRQWRRHRRRRGVLHELRHPRPLRHAGGAYPQLGGGWSLLWDTLQRGQSLTQNAPRRVPARPWARMVRANYCTCAHTIDIDACYVEETTVNILKQDRAHPAGLHHLGSLNGGSGPHDPGGGHPGHRSNETRGLPQLYGQNRREDRYD